MSETKLPEFFVGIISAYMFLWLFPIASDIENIVLTMYSANGNNASIIVSAGTLVFCIGLYGIIAIYCLGSCLEKLYYYLKGAA